ncbi:hypothetical protein HanRHA438_Chr00c06g0845771 [Helianthus annuus]|nr:hypothetical protein HanRHA438_Chr00c06g0845771 [Helianthus annuus]
MAEQRSGEVIPSGGGGVTIGTAKDVEGLDQRGELGDEKDQKVGETFNRLRSTGEDVIEEKSSELKDNVVLDERCYSKRIKRNVELKDNGVLAESRDSEWIKRNLAITTISMACSPCRSFKPKRHLFSANENVEDQEFGRDTNRNDYFAVRSLDVDYEGEDLSGGGGTRQVSARVSSTNDEDLAMKLNQEPAGSGTAAASKKPLVKKGDKRPPLWKKH